MRCEPRKLDGRDFELLVIGGGLQGAAIAREAALRDVSVLLIEAGDFGSSAEVTSPGLLSSGLSYLREGHYAVVRELLEERERLLRLSPHLARVAPVLMPSYRGGSGSKTASRFGVRMQSWMTRRSTMPRPRQLSAREALETIPELRPEGLSGAMLSYDAVVVGERLALANVQAAALAGATVANYCQLEGLGQDGSVILRDAVGQADVCIRAAKVVNATGAAVDGVRKLFEIDAPPLVRASRCSQLVLGSRSGDTALAVGLPDGRTQQLVPHLDGTLWGASGDEASVAGGERPRVTSGDLDYLLEGLGHAFAEPPKRSDIAFAFAGLRAVPLEAAPPGGLNQGGFLVEEGRPGGALHTVVGAEPATHRALAERVVARMFAHSVEDSPTRLLALPGGDGPREVVDPLWWRHGSLALDMRALLRENSGWARPLCPHRPFLEVEAVYAMRQLGAVSLGDLLLRRLIHSRGPCLQDECLRAAHGLFVSERRWPVDSDYDSAIGQVRESLGQITGDVLEGEQAPVST